MNPQMKIPRVNLHTHTCRCKHAKGNIADYCEAALKAGISILGFSDHSPFPDAEYASSRMDFSELPDYRKEIEDAKQKFPQLTILAGLEIDYRPVLGSAFYREEYLEKLNLDYMIAGVHFLPAENGIPGKGKDMHGRRGKDLKIKVPPGTIVKNAETGEIMADIDAIDKEVVVARGGKGGRGNTRFATSVNRAPREHEPGEKTEPIPVELELKMIADVGLVGFPNAGKSTLLNQLTGAAIPANNRLFDTLDTTSRLLTVSDTMDVVVSDTVGFIRKLPHQLVEAFKATLEELEYADLLLHVIDVSNPEWQHQAEVVEKLIVELGANEIPRIDVFNKCDRVEAGDLRPHGADICSISARTGEGVDRLLEMIDRRLDKGTRRVTIHLPYDKGSLLDMLYREAKVESVEYSETIDIVAVCPPKVLGQIGDYTPDWTPPKEDWE